jgi:hypothetical protein
MAHTLTCVLMAHTSTCVLLAHTLTCVLMAPTLNLCVDGTHFNLFVDGTHFNLVKCRSLPYLTNYMTKICIRPNNKHFSKCCGAGDASGRILLNCVFFAPTHVALNSDVHVQTQADLNFFLNTTNCIRYQFFLLFQFAFVFCERYVAYLAKLCGFLK